MASLDPGLEEELEPRLSDEESTVDYEQVESPGAEDKSVSGPSGSGRGWPTG